MAQGRTSRPKRKVEAYQHKGKERLNNPPAGLVTPKTDPPTPAKKTYQYDAHLDPQLVWADKAEHTSFEVPTVSLHVHERMEPRTIIEAVRRKNGNGNGQLPLFASPAENPPLREAIEFYKHRHNWSNRLIAGDSLLVMNSLLEKEGMAGQVQMVYMDPPYGVRYRSNFQPFVNRRDVSSGDRDEDLTQEPEMIRAFRDTWELGIHSYLTYLRDRLLLARDLLSDAGSIFIQIGDDNADLVKRLLAEVFGASNFVSLISFRTKIPLNAARLPNVADYLIWHAKDLSKLKFRRLFTTRGIGEDTQFIYVELPDGTRRTMSDEERVDPRKLPTGSRAFRLTDLLASGHTDSCHYEFEFNGKRYYPPSVNSWKTTPDGMKRLIMAERLHVQGVLPAYVFYSSDYPVVELTNQWTDTQGAIGKIYAVQTATKIVERCMLMSTDPGDVVLDPTCGSGTTAYVGEQWGRRWITCDTSRVAIALAKQRLMTAVFDYYELAHAGEGVDSGFEYGTVPHVTLGSIANNPEIREGMTRSEMDSVIAKYAERETLYDRPLVDRSKMRVTGPFTVEAVPAPVVKSLGEAASANGASHEADDSVARSGETIRQGEWRDELLKTGIRGKGGQRINFSRVEPLAGTRWLHADAETKGDKPERVAVSFGPDHAPLEPRQVELAIEEAQELVPRPRLIVFAAFQFDPEAAKDIDETKWPGVTLLKAQMNADLLTEDLKKKRASNESFWLVGQPEVRLTRVKNGEHKGKWQVEVLGFDYYNTRTGNIESGGTDKIAMWMLDPDYDGRSLFPRQVFFPMADENGGWARLARNLKAEIDESLIEAYRGTESLPFEAGPNKRIAVKIIDDRGIESLKVISLG